MIGLDTNVLIRYLTQDDPRQAKKARNVGIAWTVVAYIGALMIGWIGIAIFGPDGLADREYVMPSVLLEIFPPAIAAVLITGAIAAMISTADSLLILSSTELSENLIKPVSKKKINPKKSLMQSRIITALLAVIALTLANFVKEDTIFTLVSYVWAGIGGTFSIVVLFTLFWKRFHGKATLITIVAGMLFTIIWIATGMDEKFTARILTFVVAGVVAIAATLLFPANRTQ